MNENFFEWLEFKDLPPKPDGQIQVENIVQ